MFNSSQRNFAQRATTTTDNRPTVTVGVKIGVKDTYITNKTSDYASKVFEPKGSKFISLADVDFTPTEPGTYTLPLTDDDRKSITDEIVDEYQLKPSSFKTTMILPPRTWSLKGYSFEGANEYGSTINVFKKAFDESFSKDGKVVLSLQRGNTTQDLMMTYIGEFVPFEGQTAASSLNNDVLPPGLFPENLDEAVNTIPNCCDDIIEEWESNPIPEPAPQLPDDARQPWSTENPCGWLGSGMLCRYLVDVQMRYADSPLDPTTTSYRIQRGLADRGYDPSRGQFPPGYTTSGACDYLYSGPWVASGQESLSGRFCYEVLERGFNEIWRNRTICINYRVFCSYVTVDYYGTECGCPDCSCKKPQCVNHPNCISYRRDDPLSVSPNPEPVVIPDEI